MHYFIIPIFFRGLHRYKQIKTILMRKNYTNFTLIKKVSLFFLVSLFTIAVNGQPVLTSAPGAPIGTKTYGHDITGIITHTAAGPAQTWDYSSVAYNATTFYFIDVPYSGLAQQIKDTFPDGNNASELFYGVTKVATIVGKFENTYQATLGLAYTSSFQKYLVPDTFLIFPMHYLDAFDKREYDAYGTLTTPFGTYNDVVRVKEDLVADNKFRYLYFQFDPVYRILLEYKVEKTTQAIDGKYFYDLDYTTSNREVFADESSFQIFPNPSNGTFRITNNQNSLADINIFNMLGEKIYFLNNTSLNNIQIDFTNQPKGLYFISIDNGKEIITNKMVIH